MAVKDMAVKKEKKKKISEMQKANSIIVLAVGVILLVANLPAQVLTPPPPIPAGDLSSDALIPKVEFK
ncbi:MAG: hypothetical protein WBW38_13765 [Candidatus Sulfotelmatobacter sp.]